MLYPHQFLNSPVRKHIFDVHVIVILVHISFFVIMPRYFVYMGLERWTKKHHLHHPQCRPSMTRHLSLTTRYKPTPVLVRSMPSLHPGQTEEAIQATLIKAPITNLVDKMRTSTSACRPDTPIPIMGISRRVGKIMSRHRRKIHIQAYLERCFTQLRSSRILTINVNKLISLHSIIFSRENGRKNARLSQSSVLYRVQWKEVKKTRENACLKRGRI